uniref:Uncharacterized protein n=1 Tax=Branchiostoma floridae TaxID=7739 RepID=C3ZYB1_BRAFL|eukprot:XP_002586457.1 hypothetical protein BRAFLDRAFT_106907 [Branchiostoma floridae]
MSCLCRTISRAQQQGLQDTHFDDNAVVINSFYLVYSVSELPRHTILYANNVGPPDCPGNWPIKRITTTGELFEHHAIDLATYNDQQLALPGAPEHHVTGTRTQKTLQIPRGTYPLLSGPYSLTRDQAATGTNFALFLFSRDARDLGSHVPTGGNFVNIIGRHFLITQTADKRDTKHRQEGRISKWICPHGHSEPDVRMLNGPLTAMPKSHSASKLRQDRDFWAKLEEKEKEREIQAARQRLQKDLQQNRDIYNHGYFKTFVRTISAEAYNRHSCEDLFPQCLVLGLGGQLGFHLGHHISIVFVHVGSTPSNTL